MQKIGPAHAASRLFQILRLGLWITWTFASLAGLGFSAAEAQTPFWRDVTWIEPLNVSSSTAAPTSSGEATGSGLKKNAGGVAWNAGARSLEELSGDGAVEFRFDQKTLAAMVGLAVLNPDGNYTGLNYAIYGTSGGLVKICESGPPSDTTYGAYQAGEVFRIQRQGSVVSYWRAGAALPFYTSTVPALGRLFVDSSLNGATAGVSGCRLWAEEGGEWVLWEGLPATGLTADYSTGRSGLAKSAVAGWTGAVGSRRMLGDCSVQFSFGQETLQCALGLSEETAGHTQAASMDYCIESAFPGVGGGTRKYRILERGVERLRGDFLLADVFRIERKGYEIRYYQTKGAVERLVYTSPVRVGAESLQVESFLFGASSRVRDVRVRGWLGVEKAIWTAGPNAVASTVSGRSRVVASAAGGRFVSVKTLPGEGFFRFVFEKAGVTAGLRRPTDTAVQLGLRYAGARVEVLENGVAGPGHETAAGDTYGIRRALTPQGERVQYLRNGRVFHERLLGAPLGEVVAAGECAETGAAVTECELWGAPQDVVWRDLVNVVAGYPGAGSAIIKNKADALWNAGAVGDQALAPGRDGYLEFRVQKITGHVAVGLATQSIRMAREQLAHTLYFKPNGVLELYSKNIKEPTVPAVLSYAAGDLFRLRRVGTRIEFWKNGALIPTSAVVTANAAALYPNCAVYTNGCGISGAQLYSGIRDQNANSLDDRWEERFFGRPLTGSSTPGNADGDGYTDAEEYFQGSNPREYFNGQVPELKLVSGDLQTGEPGKFALEPLGVSVRIGGALVQGAPVRWEATSGGIALSKGGAASPMLEVPTDAGRGISETWFLQPNLQGQRSDIWVRAGAAAPLNFRLFTHQLLGYWNLNEGLGSVAGDQSQFAQSGTVSAGITWENSFGVGGTVGVPGGKMLRWTAHSQTVTASPAPLARSNFWNKVPLSFSAWILFDKTQPLAAATDFYPILSALNTAGRGYVLALRGGAGVSFQIRTDAGVSEVVPRSDLASLFRDGLPHYVVATRNADGGITLYVDGQDVSTPATGSKPSAGGVVDPGFLSIGNDRVLVGGLTRSFRGWIDEVRILGSCYRPDEILSLYDSDADQIPDWWEYKWSAAGADPGTLQLFSGNSDLDGDGRSDFREFQNQSDPRDYYNGQTPVLSMIAGNQQMGPAGKPLNESLKLRVRYSGKPTEPVVNAPVTFRVLSGAGRLYTGDPNTATDSVFVRTDGAGDAEVRYQQGPKGAVSSRIQAQAGTAFTEASAITEALVGRWEFADPTHRGRDTSGTGYSATVVGSAFEPGFGGNTALVLEGTTFLSMDNAGGVFCESTRPWALGFWFKLGSVPSTSTGLVSNGTGGFRMNLRRGSDGLGELVLGDNAAPDLLAGGFKPGDWNHVGLVAEPGKVGLYVNGQKKAERNGPLNTQSGPVRIGETGSVLRGALADVRSYASALPVDFLSTLERADTDGNGLLDRWEEKWFGSRGQNPNADPDGDGLNNRQEQETGTDPKDYFNGRSVRLTVLNGDNQMAAGGGVFAQKFTVSVTDDKGVALVNAPASFAVVDGSDGLLRREGAGDWSPNTELRTVPLAGGSAAVASVELKAPSAGRNTVYWCTVNGQTVQITGRAAGEVCRLELNDALGATTNTGWPEMQANDTTGAGRHGTIKAAVRRRIGPDGTPALAFQRDTDGLCLPFIDRGILPAGGGALTISFWIAAEAWGVNAPTLLSSGRAGEAGFTVGLENGCLTASLYDSIGSVTRIAAAQPVTIQKWSMVVISSSGMQVTLYLDGQKVAEGQGEMILGSSAMEFSAKTNPQVGSGPSGFRGGLDCVRIFRGERMSSSQIQMEYDSDGDLIADKWERAYGLDSSNPEDSKYVTKGKAGPSLNGTGGTAVALFNAGVAPFPLGGEPGPGFWQVPVEGGSVSRAPAVLLHMANRYWGSSVPGFLPAGQAVGAPGKLAPQFLRRTEKVSQTISRTVNGKSITETFKCEGQIELSPGDTSSVSYQSRGELKRKSGEKVMSYTDKEAGTISWGSGTETGGNSSFTAERSYGDPESSSQSTAHGRVSWGPPSALSSYNLNRSGRFEGGSVRIYVEGNPVDVSSNHQMTYSFTLSGEDQNESHVVTWSDPRVNGSGAGGSSKVAIPLLDPWRIGILPGDGAFIENLEKPYAYGNICADFRGLAPGWPAIEVQIMPQESFQNQFFTDTGAGGFVWPEWNTSLSWSPSGSVGRRSLQAPSSWTTVANYRGDVDPSWYVLSSLGAQDVVYWWEIVGEPTTESVPKTLLWAEKFTFYDDPATGADESQREPEIQIRSGSFRENVPGMRFLLSPNAESRFGEYSVLLLPVEIVPDFNRDGKIDDADRGKVTEAEPWRWWLNDDDDDGEVTHNDIPLGQTNSSNDSFLGNNVVDGSSDLLDFFPLYLDIKRLVEVMPPEQAEYRIVQENAAVSYAYTDLTAGEAGNFLRHVATVEQLKSAHTYIAFANGANRLSNVFLNKIKNEDGKGVLLIEASNTSDKPLRLEVWKGGQKVTEIKFPMRLDGVEKMYRWVNLRGVANGGSVGRATDVSEPANRPDRLTSDKHVVFLPGYNVNEQQGRGWNAEMFKRLYQSGLRSKFTAVVWRGDQGQLPIVNVTTDYWENVTNAFTTSPHLKNAVNALSGNKIMIAHSLGNMVTTSAIKDHGLSASQYFQVDAAVASEAYDQTMDNREKLRNPDWQYAALGYYPDRLWAAHWHTLFDAADGRRNLTWRQRFGPIANAHNFYSSGEDVLNNSDGTKPPYGVEGAWTLQEMVKGTKDLGAELTLDSQGGWGFNEEWFIDEVVDDPNDSEPPEKIHRRRRPNEVDSITSDLVKTQPFFKRFKDQRLMNATQGSAAANEYHTRAKTLAEGIPSLSFAAGRNSLDNYQDSNTDMMTLKTGWPRGDGRCLHSDVNNVAFRYNHQLFKRWIELGGLK